MPCTVTDNKCISSVHTVIYQKHFRYYIIYFSRSHSFVTCGILSLLVVIIFANRTPATADHNPELKLSLYDLLITCIAARYFFVTVCYVLKNKRFTLPCMERTASVTGI